MSLLSSFAIEVEEISSIQHGQHFQGHYVGALNIKEFVETYSITYNCHYNNWKSGVS